MTIKVNGFASAGQHLTGGLDYYTLTTAVKILATGVYAPYGTFLDSSGNPLLTINGVTYADETAYNAARASQMALEKIIEIVAARGQMVIMGAPSGSGPYTFRWAVEHRDSWYNLSQGSSPVSSYSPTAGTTATYDANPDLVSEICSALGTGITLYPGTAQEDTITWSTGFVATGGGANTSITISNTL